MFANLTSFSTSISVIIYSMRCCWQVRYKSTQSRAYSRRYVQRICKWMSAGLTAVGFSAALKVRPNGDVVFVFVVDRVGVLTIVFLLVSFVRLLASRFVSLSAYAFGGRASHTANGVDEAVDGVVTPCERTQRRIRIPPAAQCVLFASVENSSLLPLLLLLLLLLLGIRVNRRSQRCRS